MQHDDDINQLFEAIDDIGRALSRELQRVEGPARGHLQQLLWRCVRHRVHPLYVSQAGQDHFIDQHLMREKRNGVFVDVGGYDGITGSNSYFFEAVRGWNGLLIEPVPEYFDAAKAVRRCTCVQECVASVDGTRHFLHVREGYTQMSGLLESYSKDLLAKVRDNPRHEEELQLLPTSSLASLIRRQGITHIDCLFVDIEGAEIEVLSSFFASRIDVAVCCVENNQSDPRLPELMAEAGFERAEFIGMDEIYVSE
jgi:FkbM family methyltransferase